MGFFVKTDTVSVFRARLRLSPPWVVWQKMVRALFEGDAEIRIDAAEASAGPEVTLYVDKPLKAAALARLLPECRQFGNVYCRVAVVPLHGGVALPKAPDDPAELAVAAFGGNAAVAAVRPVSKGLFANLAYVAFAPRVVQFGADRLDDINGNWSGLYETVAREVCERADGIFFCTAAVQAEGARLAAPLGEWP